MANANDPNNSRDDINLGIELEPFLAPNEDIEVPENEEIEVILEAGGVAAVDSGLHLPMDRSFRDGGASFSSASTSASTSTLDTTASDEQDDANPEINQQSLEEIQPKFKQLSLDDKKNTKRIKLCVEVECLTHSEDGNRILSISCAPVKDIESFQKEEPASDSSGHLADTSRPSSSNSDASVVSTLMAPSFSFTRSSIASSSSASSLVSSASALKLHQCLKQGEKITNMDSTTVTYLAEKWGNSDVLFHVLDCVDKLAFDDIYIPLRRTEAKHQLETMAEEVGLLSTKKRHKTESETEGGPIQKKKKSSFPIASTSGEDILLGKGVFAKWNNRKFYYGQVTEIDEEGKFVILFLDSNVRTVARNCIIPDVMSLIGHKIMVTDVTGGDNYYPAIVTECTLADDVYKYSVATDTGDFDVELGQVYFTEAQAKTIRESSSMPSTSGEHLKPESTLSSDTSDSSSDTDLTTRSFANVCITGCEMETNIQQLNPTVKLKNVCGKLPKRGSRTDDQLLGPILKGTWFSGYQFLLTCSDRFSSASNINEVCTDSEDYPFTIVPFIHERLVHQIRLGGGQILENLDDITPAKYKETYLVTNRPCSTPKFLKCLAAGITIVSHEWVISCVARQKFLPPRTLPAGWSMEQLKFITLFDRISSTPLRGLQIRLAQLTDPYFASFWGGICQQLGANAQKFFGSYDEHIDVIIAENGLVDPIIDEAYKRNIPVLAVNWIIQTAIHGEARAYDGHPTYNHLYDAAEAI